jgi:serine/threonine protein phosphatase PrpC
LISKAHVVKDKMANDLTCGLFGVFDGHGGRQVADHCSERFSDEIRKEVLKSTGDL